MPPSASTFARGAARPLFSPSSAAFQTRQAFARASPFRRQYQHQQQSSRRWQSSTTAGSGQAAAQQVGWFKRMWDSPIGFKTVHFWAPVMKWALVLAGVSDFARPADKLSLTQNGALTATGFIWTRWCLIIKPKNVLLATVNFGLGIVGIVQVSRILLYRASLKNEDKAVAVEEKVKEGVESAKDVVVGKSS